MLAIRFTPENKPNLDLPLSNEEVADIEGRTRGYSLYSTDAGEQIDDTALNILSKYLQPLLHFIIRYPYDMKQDPKDKSTLKQSIEISEYALKALGKMIVQKKFLVKTKTVYIYISYFIILIIIYLFIESRFQ